MLTKTIKTAEISKRIEKVQETLYEIGFRCLSLGKFGLPSYTNIEAWVNGKLLIYLIYDTNTGGWDFLSSIDSTNSVENTWKKLDTLLSKEE